MENKFKKKVLFSLKTLSHEEEKRILKENKTEVNELNRRNIMVVSFALFLVIAVFLILTAFFPNYAYLRPACIIALFLPIATIALQLSGLEISPHISMYGIFGMLVLFAGVTSAFLDPKKACVIILVGIMQFSTVYVDSSLRINLSLLTGIVVYIAIVFNFKDPEMLKDELMNIFMFSCLALMVGGFTRHSQLRSLDMKHQLELKASVDALTQISNRSSFDDITTSLKESTLPVALVLVDVDGFKGINDTYGHMCGDEVLKKVASLLKEYFRLTDTAVRLGGDEFAVVMPGSTEEAYEMIEGRLKEVNRRLTEEATEACPKARVSAGVAFSDRGYRDELYKFADVALYAGKKNATEKIHLYPAK